MSGFTLQSGIADGLRYGAEFEGGMSNHLPMTLVALHRLGADATRLRAFNDHYRTRLEPLEAATEVVTKETLASFAGSHRSNAELRLFFKSQLADVGRQRLLEQNLPNLMPGVGGGAFHPLLRLGYALDIDHDDEVVEALASWVMADLRLGVCDGPPRPPREILATLRANPAFCAMPPLTGNIFDRMHVVRLVPAFAAEVTRPKQTTVATLREIALEVYANSDDNFSALHLITACHALRLVADAVPDLVAEGIAWVWQAFCSAYVTIGMPALSTSLPEGDASWDAVATAACASNDEHVIKFVYSCREEATAYGDDRYRALAARKAKVSSSIGG